MAFHKKDKIINEYIKYQLEYEVKYGQDTVILMMVGAFYECYGIDNEEETIGQIDRICDILNIQKTRLNKSVLKNSRSNPQMAGFPLDSLNKYVPMLVDSNFTVVRMDQEDDPNNKKKKIRTVTKVYSASTYVDVLESKVETNNLVSIYVEYGDEKQNNQLREVSFCSIDLTTGKNSCYIIQNEIGRSKILTKLQTIVQTLSPREILINTHGYTKTKDELERELIFPGQYLTHCYLNTVDKNFYKLSYQKTFLEKIFSQ